MEIWHSIQGNIYLNTQDINLQVVWEIYVWNHSHISQYSKSSDGISSQQEFPNGSD